MASLKINAPAHNYAKHVSQLPPLRTQVMDALSNEYGRFDLQSNQAQYKVYQILHNKAYYQGPWSNGLPQGRGICIFPDGSYYEGKFEAGEANDKEGHLILPNGASYRGQIRNSVINGIGEMKHSVGSQHAYIYKGEWKDGKPHGHGIQEYGDGSRYQGEFKNGLKNCYDSTKNINQKEKEYKLNSSLQHQGIYTSSLGERYIGQFLNGKMHGFGDYSKSGNEIRYRGQFSKGKKQGYGTLYSEIGSLTGYFENDVVNGQGTFQWVKISQQDGRVYIGNFRNSKFHGKGQIRLQNGNILQGIWQDGHNIELISVKRG